MIAIDFSDTHPTVEELQDNHVNAVGRYVGCPAPKGITLAELQAYRAVGIVVWLVFEDVVNDPTGGAPLATYHANQVLAHLNALELPFTQPVYYNAGDDSLTWQQSPGLAGYFEGLKERYLWSPTSVWAYGNGQVLSFLLYTGLAHGAWQSSSTSFPDNADTLPQTNIRQTPPAHGASPLYGTDLDQLMKADIGQYPRPV
jgi:hypothetical protein